jgi:hypothetical protein
MHRETSGDAEARCSYRSLGRGAGVAPELDALLLVESSEKNAETPPL